jgi:nitrogen fixation-related uncharacterized protein
MCSRAPERVTLVGIIIYLHSVDNLQYKDMEQAVV